MDSRSATNSEANMRPPATSIAIVVVRRLMRMNFCLSGRFRKSSISFPRRRRAVDRAGELQKFGADRDARPPGRSGVDLKTDLFVLQIEIDDDALRGKTCGVAHGEDAGALDGLHDPGKVEFSMGADKENMT